jgi:inorganic pyrophosphatase
MPITKFLQEPKKFEIEFVRPAKASVDLKKTHVPFSGSPHKHPYDGGKFILLVDPYHASLYYEFNNEDVDFAEELTSIVNMEGETVNMVLVWIKKKSVAVRCSPFLVEDLTSPS